MYSLLRKMKRLALPIDTQIDLFEKTVKPILLYGCEPWAFVNNQILEKVQLKFLKYIQNIKKSTPTHIIYGETGVYPLSIDIETRFISFWSKIILRKHNYLLTNVYRHIYNIYGNSETESNITLFNWMKFVKNILVKCGLINIWDSQSFPNDKWLKLTIKQKLKDIYFNSWFGKIENTYRLIKKKFGLEKYLIQAPSALLKYMIKFRTNDHRLPIQVGRWSSLETRERICNLCNSSNGDEYHYILECNSFSDQRKKLISKKYTQRHNVVKFERLVNSTDRSEIIKLCKFIKIIINSF